MKRGLLVGVVVLGLAGPAEAATTFEVADGQPDRPYGEWLGAVKVPTPDVHIVIEEVPVIEGNCSTDAHGCAVQAWGDRPARILLTPAADHRVFLHEIGHHFRWSELDDAECSWFAMIHRGPWDEEVFPDWYAFVARTGRRVSRRGQYSNHERRLIAATHDMLTAASG